MVRTRLLKKAVLQAALIVAAGTILGIAANAIAPWGIPWIGKERVLSPATDALLFTDRMPWLEAAGDVTPGPEPLSITLEQAKLLWDRGESVFIDSRPPYEYAEGHISGAINIPYDEIDYYRSEIAALSKDAILVIYCDAAGCDLSVFLGDELAKRGFQRVHVMLGGWLSWLEAGYPIAEVSH